MTSSDDDEPLPPQETSPSEELGSMATLLAAVARTGASALPAGTVVGGQYRIERAIGQGGMGVVYLARDTRLDRDVAVKLGSAVAPAALRRIEREAMALARLSHPNVVVVYQVGEIDGRVFIAMEHVDGGTARAWQTAAPRSAREILALYADAGDGLAAAHAAGLVHRDFKPDNVLVGGDGRPRVADFGLARGADLETTVASAAAAAAAGDATLSTQAGAIVGTPAYMPPEQLAGGELDARADQFAFAAAVWEALFGARPFDGKTPADVLAAIESQPPTPGGERARGRRVPRHVVAALRRALSPAREDRWPDMASLVAELRRDPAARRRRASLIGFAVAGGALATAGVLLLLLARDEGASPCRAAGGASHAGWTSARQAELRAAILGTGAPGAADVAARLTAILERKVAAIGASRVAACEATHVRRTQSPELLDRRNHCLDRRDGEVAALIDVARHLAAEGGDLTALLPAAVALEGPAACDDIERLAAAPAPATTPAQRAERSAIEGLIALAAARDRAGAENDALAAAREAVARAEALGDKALAAEARLRAGQVQAVIDPGGATSLLERAAREAAEARDDVLAARVAIEMMAIAIFPMRQLDEAERLRPLAESAVIRAGDPPPQRALYLAHLSRLRDYQGDHAAARAAIEEALALEAEAYGPESVELANSLNQLATVMTSQGQHAAAIEVRERTAALLAAAYGPEHPHLAVVLTNLGTSHFAQGRYPEALELIERGLAIKERAQGREHPSLIANLINLGNVLLKLERPADAMTRLERARQIAEKTYGKQHAAYAHILSVISDAMQAQGDKLGAERALVEVLAIQSDAGPDRPEMAETLFSLGSLKTERGELRGARADLERARRIAETSAGPGSELMAQALGTIALLEVAEGKPAQGRRTMQQAIATMELALGRDHPSVRSMQESLASMPAAP